MLRRNRVRSNAGPKLAACNPMATAKTVNKIAKATMTIQITIAAPEVFRRVSSDRFESEGAEGCVPFGPPAEGVVILLLPGRTEALWRPFWG
jgi:hypothetical protein